MQPPVDNSAWRDPIKTEAQTQYRPSLWLLKQDIPPQSLDPSATVYYRNLRWAIDQSERKVTLCGEINGKNQYGGYTGYQAFTAIQYENRKAVFAQYLIAPECAGAPSAE